MQKAFYFLSVALLFLTSCETTKDDTTFTDLGKVFVSSNNQSKIGIFDFSDIDNKKIVEYQTTTDSSAGIYFDSNRDIVYQVDRENKRLNAYSRLSTNDPGTIILPSAISTSDLNNPRGLTSDNNIAIVADAASVDNPENRLLMFDVSAKEITLRNEFTVDFELMDIQLVGNTLYASESGSDSLAVFNNFFANSNGAIQADFKIKLEDVNNINGIHYTLSNDLMIITDTGNLTGGIEDGQIILIEDFNLKLSEALQEASKTISGTEMLFIKGSNTSLQNPVDAVFHEFANRVIVAERSTNGGVFLSFEYPIQNSSSNELNLTPFYSINYNGISNLYFDN